MDSFTNGFGVQALDIETVYRALNNSYVNSGCVPSAGAGALEVGVSAGTVTIDGTTVGVAGQTITLEAGDAEPRKDVVYVDGSGTVQAATGTPAPAEPEGEVRRQTYQPQPTDLSGMAGVPIAEVWVPSGASDVAGADISDRRAVVALGGDSRYITDYVAAQSFEEPDIQTDLFGTQITDGSVGLSDLPLVLNLPDAEYDNVTSSWAGIVVEPKRELSGMTLTTYAGNGNDATEAHVVRQSDDEEIYYEDGLSVGPGESHTFEATLSPDDTYEVGFRNPNDWEAVRHATEAPFEASEFNVIDGINLIYSTGVASAAPQDINIPLALVSLDPAVSEDVHEWDMATFSVTEDGATVDVFVAYSDDGGSTWTRANGGDPIDRNYLLAADTAISPSDSVRMEAEISREDPNDSPALDSVAWSWRL